MGDFKSASNGRSIRKAITNRDTDETEKLTLPGETRQEQDRASETPESESWYRQQFEQDLDQKIINHLEMRYPEHISQEAVARERQQLTDFRDRRDFQDNLAEQFPSMSEAERQRVIGVTTDQGLSVQRDVRTPTTVCHERLHRFSHPNAREIMSPHLYEGMTEDIARKEFPYMLQDVPDCYPENRETLNLLQARVGERPLLDAYFKGDDSHLRAFVDHDLGEGSWDKVRDLLRGAESEDRPDPEALAKARNILRGQAR